MMRLAFKFESSDSSGANMLGIFFDYSTYKHNSLKTGYDNSYYRLETNYPSTI